MTNQGTIALGTMLILLGAPPPAGAQEFSARLEGSRTMLRGRAAAQAFRIGETEKNHLAVVLRSEGGERITLLLPAVQSARLDPDSWTGDSRAQDPRRVGALERLDRGTFFVLFEPAGRDGSARMYAVDGRLTLAADPRGQLAGRYSVVLLDRNGRRRTLAGEFDTAPPSASDIRTLTRRAFIPGDQFIPGDSFIPGDMLIPGDTLEPSGRRYGEAALDPFLSREGLLVSC